MKNRIGKIALALLAACLARQAAAQQDAGAVERHLVAPRIVLQDPAARPVTVHSVRIDTEVQGSEAQSRIELVFANPNPRILEGELQFPLLAGQSVTGLAMEVNGKLREAVPVEKARGQQVFEEVTRRQVDPALLEKTIGNAYKLRVYPLPAQGYKRVVLRVLENLPLRDGRLNLRLPVQYAEKLESIELGIKVFNPAQPPSAGGAFGALVFARHGEVYQAQVRREHFAARGMVDLRIPAGAKPGAAAQLFGGERYFRAEIPAPRVADAPRALPRRVALYWDASGSAGARNRDGEFALLDRYFKAIGQGEVELTIFRDVAQPPQRFGIVNGNWRALREALNNAPADGATRFGGLPKPEGAQEALLVSDGMATYGDQPFPDFGIPVHAISSAATADIDALNGIANRSGGRLIDLQRLTPDEAAQRLLAQPPELAALGGDGVTDLQMESRLAQDGRFLVAGKMSGAGGRLKATLRLPGGKSRDVYVDLPEAQADGSLAALTWARLKLAELEGQHRLKRAEIHRLGRRFGIPTRETSLIILDTAQDYVRYEVEPPAELAAEVRALQDKAAAQLRAAKGSKLERIVAQFRDKQQWWEKAFPKGERPVKKEAPPALSADAAPMAERAAPLAAPAMPAMPAPAPAPGSGILASKRAMPSSRAPGAAAEEPAVSIQLKAWRPDAPYLRRMRDARPDELYPIYLDERPGYLNSSAFFIDVADTLFENNQPELALRVLSNLAEMNLENRALLRILGYRLMQAGRPALAVQVFKHVKELAPNEPQSLRDLGLAYAADGQPQPAIDALWEVVERDWPRQFAEIELIALAELNAIVATAAGPLDTGRVDPRLLKNLPLDLRVVMSWDADNTDIDLWVIDPNGEKCYYGNRLSYQGARMSGDVTIGYGPEEFSLRRAKPGKYLIQANFYGHNQQVLSSATTVQVKMQAQFGTPSHKEQMLTVRLPGRKDVVTIGEFEVK